MHSHYLLVYYFKPVFYYSTANKPLSKREKTNPTGSQYYGYNLGSIDYHQKNHYLPTKIINLHQKYK